MQSNGFYSINYSLNSYFLLRQAKTPKPFNFYMYNPFLNV